MQNVIDNTRAELYVISLPVFRRPFVKRFALCYRNVVYLSACPVCLSVCLSVTLVYCGQTVGLIKMKLGTEVGLGPGNIVLDGDPSEFFWGDGPSPPPPKKVGGTAVSCPPLFGPCIVVKRLDGSRCHLVHWPRPHCVRWGPNSPSKRGL